ncbi:MAG: cellulose binding domain-containing protein [Planctomycetia bacterium]|nr:cellulose binding domain-containing protein [Planctomycetia bacterium]
MRFPLLFRRRGLTQRGLRRCRARPAGPSRRVLGGLEVLEDRRFLAGEGLTGQYFDNADFTTLKATRVDASIDFNWGTSTPATGVANTTYSVRWSGAVVPQFSELYTFTVTADDGVRLWVDDQLIITNWVNQSAKAVSGRIALRAGEATPIRLEYYQNTGSASAKLEWASPSTPIEGIPQQRLNAVATADNRGTALQETWLGISGGKVGDLTASAAYAGPPAYRQMITSLQSLQQNVADASGSRIRGFIVPSFTGVHVFSVAGNDDLQLSLSPDASSAGVVRIAFTSAITAPFDWTKTASQTSAPVSLVQGQRYFFEILHKEASGYDHWAVGWTTPASSQTTVIGSDNIEPWGATTPLPATGILNGMSTSHDRILASPEMFQRAKSLVAQGGQFQTLYASIKTRADLYLTDDLPASTAPSSAAGGTQPVLSGLEDNLTYLAGAYRLVKEVEGTETNALKYFDKAKAIIQRVIQWSTWDTGSQFLGAAMVSQGISVCYDWMYDTFTAVERKQIADALYTLAIKPTIDTCTAQNYWTQWYGNWAFVCIGGVGNAALAIAPEYYKAEAETLIAKGWPVLRSSMQHFAGENGGWHEGPGYMGYGALFLIRFMSNLQTAVGTDYGLSLEKGFAQLPNYLLAISTNVTGSGNNGTYPYSDGDWSQNGDPWFNWLAARFNRGDVAKIVQDRSGSQTTTTIVTAGVSSPKPVFSFQTPWSLLWYDPRGDQSTGLVRSPGAAATATDASFYGDPSLRQWGTTGQTNYSEHVNVWRDSWSNTTAAVMFKGGYKGTDGHDNLDGGSFIFDALGQRWATDLGRDSYSIAAVGGTNYGAYRKRAEGHNTLVINPAANDYLSSTDANEKALNADQVFKDVAGKPAYSPVIKSLSTDLQSVGVVELTNLYSKMRVSSVQRGFLFDRTDDSLLVQDEIKAGTAPEINWFMHVPVAWANRGSQIAISGEGKTVTVTLGTNRLQLKILAGTGATFTLMEAKPLTTSPNPTGQSSNAGVTKLAIRYTGTTNERLAVWMVPLTASQSAPTITPVVTSLASWTPRANRQAWAGDIDDSASASAADASAASAAWSAQIVAATGKAAKGLDDPTAGRITPVTLTVPLAPGEQVTWAKLVAGLKATSGATTASDQLSLDATTGQSYASIGWSTLDTSGTSRELTLSAAQLAQLQDGILNVAFSPNTTVDWVQLQYTTLDATAPTATLTATPAGTSATAVDTVAITFSEPVAGFGLEDLALSRGGTPLSLAGATLTTANSRTFTLGSLSGITSTSGGYSLVLVASGSGIVDSSGNAMTVSASTAWTLATPGPTAAIVPSPTGTSALPVGSATITFSKPVTGMDRADLTLVRDGTPVSLAAATLTTLDNTTFTLGSLGSSTSVSGTYVLALSASGTGISDSFGNPLGGAASATWTLDATPPTATLAAIPPGTSASPVESVTVTFSEPVTGFGIEDLLLTLGGAPVSLAGSSLATIDNRTYRLEGLLPLTSTDGSYVLTLTAAGSGVVDSLGNALGANASVAWTLDTSLTVAVGQTTFDATPRSGAFRLVKRGPGTLVLTVSGTFSGGTVVEEGVLLVQDLSGLGTGPLEVRAGATARLDVRYGTVPISALVLASGGRIDVATGKLNVAAGGFDDAMLRQWLVAGRNGGAWDGGTGIVSSNASVAGRRAVGYRISGGVATFGWAAIGDTNLDGQVNPSDMQLVIASGRYAKPLDARWDQGDFDYSGRATASDMQLLLTANVYGKGSYLTAPVTVTYVQSNAWSSGFTGDVRIVNNGSSAINGWTLEFELAATITNIWNAEIVSRVGNRYVIRSAAWNATLAAGGEVSFGFQADGIAGTSPLKIKFNGVTV